MAIAETHPSTAPPGTKWAYSNTNHVVAGLLVEAVTGHRVGQELRTRIFDPLRPEDTSPRDQREDRRLPRTRVRAQRAHATEAGDAESPTPDGRFVDVTELNRCAAWAAGAIISNGPDLSRFYRALITGSLLTPSMLREMKTTIPPARTTSRTRRNHHADFNDSEEQPTSPVIDRAND